MRVASARLRLKDTVFGTIANNSKDLDGAGIITSDTTRVQQARMRAETCKTNGQSQIYFPDK